MEGRWKQYDICQHRPSLRCFSTTKVCVTFYLEVVSEMDHWSLHSNRPIYKILNSCFKYSRCLCHLKMRHHRASNIPWTCDWSINAFDKYPFPTLRIVPAILPGNFECYFQHFFVAVACKNEYEKTINFVTGSPSQLVCNLHFWLRRSVLS